MFSSCIETVPFSIQTTHAQPSLLKDFIGQQAVSGMTQCGVSTCMIASLWLPFFDCCLWCLCHLSKASIKKAWSCFHGPNDQVWVTSNWTQQLHDTFSATCWPPRQSGLHFLHNYVDSNSCIEQALAVASKTSGLVWSTHAKTCMHLSQYVPARLVFAV